MRSISVQGNDPILFGHRSDNLPEKRAIWFDTNQYCDDSYASVSNNNRDPHPRPISATSRQSLFFDVKQLATHKL